MSYNKAMKHANNHRNDKFYQPILGMPFDGLKEGEHVESYASVANRTATGFNVRVRDDRYSEFKQISEDFKTEDEAVDFCKNNDLDNKYAWVRIYSTEGMHISGW
jgi:hypothetical protein